MRRLLPLALATCLLAVPGAALAAPALDGSFTVSGEPQRLTLGPDGNVWFTLANSSASKEFGRIKPDGTVTEYDTPADHSVIGITAGMDGNLWMTSPSFGVIRVNPANPTAGTAFPILNLVQAQTIVAGPDGNLWTGSGDKIFKVGTDGGEKDHYTVIGLSARGIAAGGDGNLWVADFTGTSGTAGRIIKAPTNTPPSDAMKFDSGRQPQEVSAGPSGQLGFSQPTVPPQFFGRIDYSGFIQQTNVPTGTDPFGIVFGNDLAYWTAEFGANALGRVTTAGAHTQLPLAAASGPRYLTKGANDTLWVGLQTAKKIARITGVSAPATPPPPPAGTPPDTTAPAVTTYALSSKVIRAFASGGSTARATRGAKVSYTLTEPATAAFTVQRLTKGRRVKVKGKTRCVRRTRANARRKKCTRRVPVGSFTRPSGVGPNVFTFTGRLRTRALKPGRYRLLLVATDAAGNASPPRALRFRVVKQ